MGNTESFLRKYGVRRTELYVVGVATALVAMLAIHFDAFERLAHFVEGHDAWQLDEVIIVLLFSGGAAFTLLLLRAKELRAEVGRRQAAEERATDLARHDPLTGLPNRRVLIEEVDAALVFVSDASAECAVLLIDLDLFKPVNDIHGHATGDAVLIEVASRLRSVVADKGTVARMGGDEFACIICYMPGSDLPSRIAANLIRTLAEPILIEGTRMQIGSTIGITRAPQDGTTASELLHGADLAMYQGKRCGRGVYHFFDAEMDTHLRERSELETDLRAAVDAGEIIPHFQPIVDLVNDTIIAFEALARWQHPIRGVIPPDTFIPIAEDLGIIDKLFYAMLRKTCEAAREWPASLHVSINIAPVQLKDPWLAPQLLAILTETGFAPSRLIVEITENSAIEDMIKAKEVFESLQNAGVMISLDDFGKGYSSLYHLRQLRFNQLKIDGSFIHAMGTVETAKIVSAVTGLGKALGMPVTAEGVETAEEADALRAFGCEHAQGYLFGKALSATETMALIAANATKRTSRVRAA